MPVSSRLLLILYSLLGLALAGAVTAVAMGWSYPLAYLTAVGSTAESRMVVGAVGVLLAIVFLMVLIWALTTAVGAETVIVQNGPDGEISMSIPAAQVIIMKAVKRVEGLKELKPIVHSSSKGLTVKLHAMINPDFSVPDIAQSLQTVVKEDLAKYGGLQVAEIKVFVDDFNTGSK